MTNTIERQEWRVVLDGRTDVAMTFETEEGAQAHAENMAKYGYQYKIQCRTVTYSDWN